MLRLARQSIEHDHDGQIDEGVKVTIALSKRSVEFFKGEARKHRTQYQRMIRRLLDAYTAHHTARSRKAS